MTRQDRMTWGEEMMVSSKILRTMMKVSLFCLRKISEDLRKKEVQEENSRVIETAFDKHVDLALAKRSFELFRITGWLLCMGGLGLSLITTLLGVAVAATFQSNHSNIFFLVGFPLIFSVSSVGMSYWYHVGSKSLKKIDKRLKMEPDTTIFTRTFFNTPNDIGTIFFFLIGLIPGILAARFYALM